MARTISNSDDVIDSRDVIERIATLKDEITEAGLDPENLPKSGSIEEEDVAWQVLEVIEELEALLSLANEGEQSPDWEHGEALIRDSYFTEYAQELASDIGAISSDAQWPLNHIDWDAAAEALKRDYMEVDFDGEVYWIRA